MTSVLWPIVDFDDVKGGFDEKWVCVATMAVRVLHVPSIIQTPQREALHCDALSLNLMSQFSVILTRP